MLTLNSLCVRGADGSLNLARSYDEDTALTCGKAIAGMFAQSKGRAIGIYEPREKGPEVRFFCIPLARAALHIPSLHGYGSCAAAAQQANKQ